MFRNNLPLVTFLIFSFLSHISSLFVLKYYQKSRLSLKQKKESIVKLKIIKKEAKPKPKVMPKPKIAKKIPPKKKKVTTLRKKPKKVTKIPPKVIQGLSKSSFSSEGQSGFVAPVGNTLMTKDEGIRVDKNKAIKQVDLSKDAELLSFQKPEYTDDAIDNDLEGVFIVSVFVTAEGSVSEAELESSIGFGMDRLIIEASKNAIFSPRKNKFGKPMESWTEIQIRLEIP